MVSLGCFCVNSFPKDHIRFVPQIFFLSSPSLPLKYPIEEKKKRRVHMKREIWGSSPRWDAGALGEAGVKLQPKSLI